MSNTTAPKVSVLVVTYNHEKYIRKALDSVMMQETDFDIEVVIADDCSQDATLSIIQQYWREYGDRLPNLRILPSEKNVGITRNYQRGFAACQGEYIAIIEGDDFWTSPTKLKSMTAFLHEHRECAFSFHRFLTHEEGSGRFTAQPFFEVASDFALLSAAQLIRENFVGNFSTCMYRREVLANLDQRLFEMKVYDWMLNIVVAQEGMIGYIPKVMSVYRLHSQGTWSGKTAEEKLLETLNLIDVYNKYLNFKFDVEFQEHKNAILDHTGSVSQMMGTSPLAGNKRPRNLIAAFTPPILKAVVKYCLPPILTHSLKQLLGRARKWHSSS